MNKYPSNLDFTKNSIEYNGNNQEQVTMAINFKVLE